jgi:hypothetical protein
VLLAMLRRTRTGLVLVTIGGTRPKQTTQIEDMTTIFQLMLFTYKQTLTIECCIVACSMIALKSINESLPFSLILQFVVMSIYLYKL